MSEAAPDTIVTVLRSDHAAITRALVDVRTVDAASGADRFAELAADVVRHFVAEEQYLLPAVRDHLADGAAVSDRSFAEHERIEGLLKQLDDEGTGEHQLGGLLDQLAAALEAHVSAQESELFPALIQQLDRAQLVELGQDVLGAEQLAPTHPRYFVPRSATLSKLTSWLTGLVEKSLDSRGAPD